LTTEQAAASPFPVTWDDPGEETFAWERDPMHFPQPVTPLTAAFLPHFREATALACEELQMPMIAMRCRAANGWVYFATERPADEEIPARVRRNGEVLADRMDRIRTLWDVDYQPRVEAIFDELTALDFDAATALDAKAQLARVSELYVELWRIHFLLVFVVFPTVERFFTLYNQVTGTSDETEGYRCLQGLPNKSLEADGALYDLAAAAAESPLVAEVLSTEDVDSAFTRLDESPEGRDFRTRLDDYLERYGYRANVIDLAAPLWVEDP
jgi:hypothetical protein